MMSTIEKISMYPISIPYKQTAGYAGDPYQSMLNAVVVSVQTSDGETGYGDALPDIHFTGESIETVVIIIKRYLAPAIFGLNVFALEEIHSAMDTASVEGTNPSAKAALDIALYDLIGKITNQPVHQLLGGELRSRIQQVPEIVFDEIDVAVSRCQEAVSQGVQWLKIKVGGVPKQDVELVKRIRQVVGEDIELTTDANQGWRNYWTAQKIGRQLEEYNIAVLEQPLRAHDLKGHAELRTTLDMPIMLDESVCSMRDAIAAIELDACDIISVKLHKCGGLWRARQLVNFCTAHGIPCHMGTNWETELGWSANLHAIVALPGIQLWDAYSPSEIYWGPKASITDEPIRSTVQEGVRMVEIPEGPGLGITVDLEVVKKYLVQKPIHIKNPTQ